MIKFAHMVDDKLRPFSWSILLVTQQPLGGKHNLVDNVGEMEVWVEAYGASNVLQEILTYKSDDVNGRLKSMKPSLKVNQFQNQVFQNHSGVLVKELQSLGLDMRVLDEDDNQEIDSMKVKMTMIYYVDDLEKLSKQEARRS